MHVHTVRMCSMYLYIGSHEGMHVCVGIRVLVCALRACNNQLLGYLLSSTLLLVLTKICGY